jgi:YbgC/YbaW family acyl-CoA thioester hydrolase
MSEVDGAGLIYFAAPMPWAERLFSDWLAELGHTTRSLFESGVAYPVVDAHVEYLSPLTLDDVIRLELTAPRIGTKSFVVRTQAIRTSDQRVCARVELVHVYVTGLGGDLKPTPLPGWLAAALHGEVAADGNGGAPGA